MNKQAILYLVAAGINLGSGRTIALYSVLLMVAAVVLAWLGIRKRDARG